MGKKRISLGNIVLISLLLVVVWALLPSVGLDLAGFGHLPLDPSKPDQAPVSAQKALRQLGQLEVKPVDNTIPYDRKAFGQAWADENRNGCDTRNDILARDLSSLSFKAHTRNCVVLSGVLADPYTGKTINFHRGNQSSKAVQIDHVVALGAAWNTGAAHWDAARRRAFANDPLVLLAVDGQANQDKGAMDASRWLPPNEAFHCHYASQQIQIKSKWGLWLSPAERYALLKALGTCT